MLGMNGPIVKIRWNDAAQQVKTHAVNIMEPVENLSIGESVGEMIAKDDKAIILVNHWNDVDGVDIVTIPTDWCQEIEVLKECITENSESQPELESVKTSKK